MKEREKWGEIQREEEREKKSEGRDKDKRGKTTVRGRRDRERYES